jgi:hypothetical protein
MDSTADRAPPAAWIEALDRSAAEIAEGQTVPLGPILDALRASAERLEGRKRTVGALPRSPGAVRPV